TSDARALSSQLCRCPGSCSFRIGVASQAQKELKGFVPRGALLAQHAQHAPHEQNPLLRRGLMIAHVHPLIEALAEMPDFRKRSHQFGGCAGHAVTWAESRRSYP